jgi:hypothetical protein
MIHISMLTEQLAAHHRFLCNIAHAGRVRAPKINIPLRKQSQEHSEETAHRELQISRITA